MVVDDELYALLELLDGRLTLSQAILKHGKRWHKSKKQVSEETRPILHRMMERGIVGASAEKQGITPGPVSISNITVNLTNRCNLRCHWCYNGTRKTKEIALSRLIDAIIGIKPLCDREVSLIILGGEPTIDIERLVGLVKAVETEFIPAPMVSTNGTFLTDYNVARIAEQRLEVQVSLDSYDPSRHDAVRGKGVFKKATDGIRRLVAADVHTIVSMVYTRENISDFEGYLNLALQLGVNEARFIPMRTIGGGLKLTTSLPDQLVAFKNLLEILDRRPEFRPLLLRDYFSILMAVFSFGTPRTSCGLGRKVIFLDADGSVYPCPNFAHSQYLCGNLHEKSLKSLLKDSEVMRQMRHTYHVDKYESCSECAFRYWCVGDCRGEVLALTGDPLAKAPHCEELKNLYLQILWLLADGDKRFSGTNPEVSETFK